MNLRRDWRLLRSGLTPTLVLFVVLVCVTPSQCARAGEKRLLDVTLVPPTLMDKLRDLIGSALDGTLASLTEKLVQAQLSPECVLGLLKLVRAARRLEPWAFRCKLGILALHALPSYYFSDIRMLFYCRIEYAVCAIGIF